MAAGAGNTRKSLRRLGFELTAVSGARYGSGQEHAETKEPIPGQYVQRVKHGGPLPGEELRVSGHACGIDSARYRQLNEVDARRYARTQDHEAKRRQAIHRGVARRIAVHGDHRDDHRRGHQDALYL